METLPTLAEAQAVQTSLNDYPNTAPSQTTCDNLSKILSWNSTPMSSAAIASSWVWSSQQNIDWLEILAAYIRSLTG